MSINSTNPGTLFGGTWEAIAQGRTIIGQGTIKANNDNWCGTVSAGDWTAGAGKMGGEISHTLTVEQMPEHTHISHVITKTGTAVDHTWGELQRGGDGGSVEDKANIYSYNDKTGGSKSHNNLPPYLVVYIWKRTK